MKKGNQVTVTNDLMSYPHFNHWVEKHTPHLYNKYLASTDTSLCLYGVVARQGEIGIIRSINKYNDTQVVILETEERVIVIDIKGVSRMTYGIQKNIDKVIDTLAKLEDYAMLEELEKITISIKQLEEKKRNCKSDMLYWGLVASTEEDEAVRTYIENRIFEYLRNYSPLFIETEKNNKRLENIKQKAITTIKELNEYKPTNYKKMIEIIEKVVK